VRIAIKESADMLPPHSQHVRVRSLQSKLELHSVIRSVSRSTRAHDPPWQRAKSVGSLGR
jgi:hypothetical protein